ncbi:unnamed protein product [Citrullus colocynthis]|uniref:Gnk2-homologous domain-containing protein n=1 Tax=Citrullus colocynthis TaxID=252529 RepID=A0ABP0Y750_9ROSI
MSGRRFACRLQDLHRYSQTRDPTTMPLQERGSHMVCLLKYSNAKFFGKNQNGGFRFYLVNVHEADDPTSLKEQVKNLLSGLSEMAKTSKNLYAIGDSEIGSSKKLYGLVQCTRDLRTADCKKCLDDAIAELPYCCANGAKVGGRVELIKRLAAVRRRSRQDSGDRSLILVHDMNYNTAAV